MTRPQIKLSSAGMRALLNSDQVRPPLRAIAERAAARARSTGPKDTHEYVNSIRVESDTTDRAVERVVAHDDKAAVIEARTGNLKRALGR